MEHLLPHVCGGRNGPWSSGWCGGLGREMDTGEEGCMAMTFQPGAGQPVS